MQETKNTTQINQSDSISHQTEVLRPLGETLQSSSSSSSAEFMFSCLSGQGGVSPAAVADSMVEAVVDFVRKKHARRVRSVKILIFQTAMLKEFHSSMKRRQGEEVQEKGFMEKIKGIRRFLQTSWKS